MFARFRNLFSKNKVESEETPESTTSEVGTSPLIASAQNEVNDSSEEDSKLEGLNFLKSLVEKEQKASKIISNVGEQSLSQEVAEMLRNKLSNYNANFMESDKVNGVKEESKISPNIIENGNHVNGVAAKQISELNGSPTEASEIAVMHNNITELSEIENNSEYSNSLSKPIEISNNIPNPNGIKNDNDNVSAEETKITSGILNDDNENTSSDQLAAEQATQISKSINKSSEICNNDEENTNISDKNDIVIGSSYKNSSDQTSQHAEETAKDIDLQNSKVIAKESSLNSESNSLLISNEDQGVSFAETETKEISDVSKLISECEDICNETPNISNGNETDLAGSKLEGLNFLKGLVEEEQKASKIISNVGEQSLSQEVAEMLRNKLSNYNANLTEGDKVNHLKEESKISPNIIEKKNHGNGVSAKQSTELNETPTEASETAVMYNTTRQLSEIENTSQLSKPIEISNNIPNPIGIKLENDNESTEVTKIISAILNDDNKNISKVINKSSEICNNDEEYTNISDKNDFVIGSSYENSTDQTSEDAEKATKDIDLQNKEIENESSLTSKLNSFLLNNEDQGLTFDETETKEISDVSKLSSESKDIFKETLKKSNGNETDLAGSKLEGFNFLKGLVGEEQKASKIISNVGEQSLSQEVAEMLRNKLSNYNANLTEGDKVNHLKEESKISPNIIEKKNHGNGVSAKQSSELNESPTQASETAVMYNTTRQLSEIENTSQLSKPKEISNNIPNPNGMELDNDNVSAEETKITSGILNDDNENTSSDQLVTEQATQISKSMNKSSEICNNDEENRNISDKNDTVIQSSYENSTDQTSEDAEKATNKEIGNESSVTSELNLFLLNNKDQGVTFDETETKEISDVSKFSSESKDICKETLKKSNENETELAGSKLEGFNFLKGLVEEEQKASKNISNVGEQSLSQEAAETLRNKLSNNKNFTETDKVNGLKEESKISPNIMENVNHVNAVSAKQSSELNKSPTEASETAVMYNTTRQLSEIENTSQLSKPKEISNNIPNPIGIKLANDKESTEVTKITPRILNDDSKNISSDQIITEQGTQISKVTNKSSEICNDKENTPISDKNDTVIESSYESSSDQISEVTEKTSKDIDLHDNKEVANKSSLTSELNSFLLSNEYQGIFFAKTETKEISDVSKLISESTDIFKETLNKSNGNESEHAVSKHEGLNFLKGLVEEEQKDVKSYNANLPEGDKANGLKEESKISSNIIENGNHVNGVSAKQSSELNGTFGPSNEISSTPIELENSLTNPIEASETAVMHNNITELSEIENITEYSNSLSKPIETSNNIPNPNGRKIGNDNESTEVTKITSGILNDDIGNTSSDQIITEQATQISKVTNKSSEICNDKENTNISDKNNIVSESSYENSFDQTSEVAEKTYKEFANKSSLTSELNSFPLNNEYQGISFAETETKEISDVLKLISEFKDIFKETLNKSNGIESPIERQQCSETPLIELNSEVKQTNDNDIFNDKDIVIITEVTKTDDRSTSEQPPTQFQFETNCENSHENSPEFSESSKSSSMISVRENNANSTTPYPTTDCETNLYTNSSIVVEDLPSEVNTPSPTVDSHISGSSSSNTSTLDSSTINELADPTKIIVNPINSNILACNAITSKLSDIADVAESLDTVIRNIQENSQSVVEAEVESNPSPSDKKLSTLRSTSSEDWHSRSTEDDSFATASEGNFTPHSQSSSSFQTASGRTSSYISCDKSSFEDSEAHDSAFAFEMPELTSPLNISFEESEQSYRSAQQLDCNGTVEDHEQTPTKLSDSGGSQTLNLPQEDQNSIADIEDIHSESVTPTPLDEHDCHVDSIAVESETELEVAGISDAPSMEIITETTVMPMSRTPEVSSSVALAACSNQQVLNNDGPPLDEQNTNKPNAAWRRSKYYENITKQTIKGFL